MNVVEHILLKKNPVCYIAHDTYVWTNLWFALTITANFYNGDWVITLTVRRGRQKLQPEGSTLNSEPSSLCVFCNVLTLISCRLSSLKSYYALDECATVPPAGHNKTTKCTF